MELVKVVTMPVVSQAVLLKDEKDVDELKTQSPTGELPDEVINEIKEKLKEEGEILLAPDPTGIKVFTKKDFDNTVMFNGEIPFPIALSYVMNGRKAKRKSWDNGYIYLKMEEATKVDGKEIQKAPYIALMVMEGDKGVEQPYVFNILDIASSDWELL